jgi:hypothetical protein
MSILFAAAALLALSDAEGALVPAPEVEQVKHRITGLFGREREEDLREAAKRMAGVALVSIDFDTAEATFEYDPAKLFKDSKPKDYLERFDNMLRQASAHTFGARALCTTSREKLTRVEIPLQDRRRRAGHGQLQGRQGHRAHRSRQDQPRGAGRGAQEAQRRSEELIPGHSPLGGVILLRR